MSASERNPDIGSILNRRDFLKLAAGLSLSPFVGTLPSSHERLALQTASTPNIIILIFDALSAFHLHIYGYHRETCPNFARFAERAVVYHNHHAAANFTTPSTASLFTSTYPWEHRAYTLRGLINPKVESSNIFRLIGEDYYKAAYTQNVNADMLLHQLETYLDQHEPTDSFTFLGTLLYNHLPEEEAIPGLKSLDQFLIKREPPRGSLFLSLLYDFSYLLRYRFNVRGMENMYPLGMPSLIGSYVHYSLGQVMDGVISMLKELPAPFLSYIHLLPPHHPYRPDERFHKLFNDGWNPMPKKRHPLGNGPRVNYPNKRQLYDEFIANLDFEFGRLLDDLERNGLLETSYLILTSDHGELFERGHRGHTTPLLFQPLLRVPLLISNPGGNERKDIYKLTSTVDLLPTILRIAGKEIPQTAAGQILPGLGFEESSENADQPRTIWALEARTNSTRGLLREATLSMLRKNYKLVYYHGYPAYQNQYEFYDLKNDPDELVNRYGFDPIADEMELELDSKFDEINVPI